MLDDVAHRVEDLAVTSLDGGVLDLLARLVLVGEGEKMPISKLLNMT